MSYTQFKNDFLVQAESRLATVNLATASVQELLLHSALYKKASEVASADLAGYEALGLLNSMSGAELQTWLTDAENLASFKEATISPQTMTAVIASSTAMTAVAASSTAMTAVAASSTAMTAVIASSTAMTAVIASSTAMTAVAASSTAMTAVIASPTALAAVAASSTAMTAVIASPTALAAVIASPTALAAVAASSTAMSAVNNSGTALNALYASPLVSKYNYGGSAWSSNPQAVRNGKGIMVRYTQKGDQGGWGNSASSVNVLKYDSVDFTLPCTTTNPYDFTQVDAAYKRVPATAFNSSLSFYSFNAFELAYIPLSS